MVTFLADGSDYFDRTIPAVTISASTATGAGTIRRACTFLRIFDDNFYEEDNEDFDLILELNPDVIQSGIILNPNVSTVCIMDNDGKHVSLQVYMLDCQKYCGSVHFDIPYVEVVIDFIDAPYEVNETDGVAIVTVGVLRDQLMREVVVELSFSDGTAIGKHAMFD